MKVLVAEDDRHTLDGLRQILEMEGYGVVAARHGREALDRFRSERPDFVCLDIMMPEVNGYDVCRAIRRENGAVPIIFISAKSEEIDAVLGLEVGADDYIVKPFGVKEVVARIRAVTRRCLRGRPTESFALGDLQVFPAELRAVRGERTIDLSLRDVRILSAFAARPGQVLTRAVLFREGWGLERVPNSRCLDQHISQLRKRIENQPGSPKIIVTVHGAGYRWDPDGAAAT